MSTEHTAGDFSTGELRLLAEAAAYLENPSLLMQLANAVGKPLEFVVRTVDKVAPGRVEEAVQAVDYEISRMGRAAAESALPRAAWRDGSVPASLLASVGPEAKNIGDALRLAVWRRVTRGG